ncbi:hypothetical protein H0G86_005857 [Trichoderma simmonsii]|uniref:Uncharacterized protein n=1 Tax=Trichoderma simmonsii TaxID=1491479 RepID=A0A8G0LF14_9HYPO|nr:hypothetical protein H0G86_005857 [Trichoderma simmonsii]
MIITTTEYYELLSFFSLSLSLLSTSLLLVLFSSFVHLFFVYSRFLFTTKKTSPSSPDIILQNCKNIPSAPQVPGSHRVSSGNTPTKVSDLLSWLRSSIAGGGSRAESCNSRGSYEVPVDKSQVTSPETVERNYAA